MSLSPTEPHSSFMDVSEAPLHLFRFPPRLPYCLIGPDRLFLSPYIFHHTPLGNVFRLKLCIRNCSSFRSPVVSKNKGHATTASKGLCEVVWTIEADLAAGQLLYITGDPTVLGCWQPEMGILMCPTELANLWKAEIKVPSGVNFKYNYFIKEETWPSSDIIWRPGPEFSLSVPPTLKQDGKVMVRDSWMKFNSERSPAYVWGSWIEESPVQPLIASPVGDEHEMTGHLEIDLEERKPVPDDFKVNNKLAANDEDAVTIAGRGDFPNSFLYQRDQPVEEPWLFHSSVIFLVSKDKITPAVSKSNDTVEDVTKLDFNDQQFQVKDKLLPADGRNLILKDDSVSTIILINSSICTMQRIAVLEDGKLVELLLEPVKSNVQCDSVYLGVVTKLVPHMGGAFVNIGSSRPSLMDIKQNREPFIFPPFRWRTKKGEVNGSVLDALEELPASHGNEHASFDIEVTDDAVEFISHANLVQFMHDEHEEQEVYDDFDISEPKEYVNGSVVNYEVEADSEHLQDEREHHLEDENRNSSLPVETEGSDDSSMSRLQDMKEANYVLTNENKWAQVRKGTKIIVQVVKEGLGTKGPTLTAYPKLKSRFWILIARCDRIGVSKKISGVERTRLKVITKTLQPPGFGLTVRTVAAGHSLEELQKDLEGLLSTWKNILEHAKSAALAADEGVEGAIPVTLHRAMGQTLSVVQDYFNDKVKKMVVDSPRTYHEVTSYLQEIASDLCDRVELYDKRIPLFDQFNIEEEINNILSKSIPNSHKKEWNFQAQLKVLLKRNNLRIFDIRVPLMNGGSLVIEQTEALVSIDVNGGHVMFGHGTSQEKAILEVNIAAAKQIARELRLRDIGGIIVVDFIDMADDANKRLVYEEVKRAVERDRSTVKVSELSKYGLMEITRKRVRPSVTFMISEPCTCCHATGRVESLETSFSKIEQEICRLLAIMDQKADPESPKTWPRFILKVDHHMCNYLTSGKRTRLAILSSSLKVWLILKVARGFTRGAFEVNPFVDNKVNTEQRHVAISVLQQGESRTNNSGRKVTLVPIKKDKVRGK